MKIELEPDLTIQKRRIKKKKEANEWTMKLRNHMKVILQGLLKLKLMIETYCCYFIALLHYKEDILISFIAERLKVFLNDNFQSSSPFRSIKGTLENFWSSLLFQREGWIRSASKINILCIGSCVPQNSYIFRT